ncbi:acyl-CoA thioesterase II [Novosphingobium sp. Leaf2]|nr:acyl-CoA thioesterase II [Novosphingobium sp. Leaf2]
MIDAAAAVAELRALLDVEEIDTHLYRGAAAEGGYGRVYGGQVVAQALAAAARSVGASRQAHSLHAYFLRAGDATRPIVYRVLPDFDGGSFANRRVVAMQGGVPILNLAASFHREENGFAHATAAPDVPAPDACPELTAALAANGRPLPQGILNRLAAFEMRAGPPASLRSETPRQFVWFRVVKPMAADDVMNRVALAYASDFGLLSTAITPHAPSFSPDMQVASLDHALWFHATPKVDEWLLYTMDSPWSGHARGFARGTIYDAAGTLIASVAQEGLCRMKTRAPT